MEIKDGERCGCPAGDNFNGGDDDFDGAKPWIGMTMMLAMMMLTTDKRDLMIMVIEYWLLGWVS